MNPARDWASLDRQAEELYTKGDLKEAIRISRLAVSVAAGAQQSARSLDRLGFFEYTSGNLKDGETFLRQALELRKTTLGAESADYAESANDLALFCRDSGKLPEARLLAEQAVTIRSRLLGPQHLRVAESLNTLGSILGLMGEYDLAIARFEQARDIHESQPREFSEEYGTLCINLAGTYQRIGKYAKAEAAFEKGLEVLRGKPGVNHPAYSASLVAYATLQADLGHYSAAEKLYDESGRLMREQLGEQHPYYATFLNNRAALYATLGNVTVAEADYRKSLELKRKVYGPAALTIGASLRNLARLVAGRDPVQAAKLFQEAAGLYGKNPKAPAFDYASALLGLAEAQRNRGDLRAAGESLRQAHEVAGKGLGARHPLYAAVLRDLARLHQSERQYAKAEQWLQEAIAIIMEAQGESHPDLAQYLEGLAVVHDEAGDYRAAEPLYRRSLDISDRALTDMLAIGSERGKAGVVANRADPIPILVSFQRRVGDRFPAAIALAFEAVARRKGRVLDQMHDWGQRVRENSDGSVRDRFHQREVLLQCQASLSIALGYRDLKPALVGTCALTGTGLEGRYERLLHDLRSNRTDALAGQALEAVTILQRRIETLETGLSREIPRFGSVIRSARLEDIRSGIAPDEMLIEFVSYRERDSRAPDRRYGAFLLGSSGDPRWADLGLAGPIDQAVRDLIAAANDWSVSLAGNERRSAESATETAKNAMGLLSKKLGPAIGGVVERKDIKRLRIAPDGMLNLIPFGALSDTHGHFVIEHFAISYVSAGRDLIRPVASAGAARPSPRSTIIAVSPGASVRRTVPGPAGSAAFRADRLERLAGAEGEGRNLRRWLPRAQLLGEGQSTEQRIKQLQRPALLHIVGHGIVRGNEDCQTAPASPGCGLEGIDPAARVMSLSAIVLEEAYGRGGASSQDGLLTALELQMLDLEGSEMLVLSQCRMADGVPSSGEGVFGMRRAAVISGVKTFVAPLWKVADDTQRTLMGRFYQQLSAGNSRTDALRQAQLQLLRNPRTASFLQWAPVILSGDPAPLPKDLFAP